jgi:uncharacterized membrane protein YdbT with pleckstrin-like domain
VLVPSLVLALVGYGLQQGSMHDVFKEIGLPDLGWWWDDVSMATVGRIGLDLDAFLSAVASVLALVTLLSAFMRSRRTRFVVTSTRVAQRGGLLSSRESSVPYQCVDAISVSKGVLGRLLGYGTVKVAGPGATAKWRHVERPDALRRAADARLHAWLCRDLGRATVGRRPASA